MCVPEPPEEIKDKEVEPIMTHLIETVQEVAKGLNIEIEAHEQEAITMVEIMLSKPDYGHYQFFIPFIEDYQECLYDEFDDGNYLRPPFKNQKYLKFWYEKTIDLIIDTASLFP